ncbi:hypothetical protein CKAN_02752000 [Cinnamomum micranthum f. kanehirae]|uniref:Uncharacterized protein n=1 Tax=Cinnamomum micranthum f. kanehirae TaxID=337451 RepID=A0A3S3P0E3_9MAGN|nr:hypothetical protein CKAN_02752000 [Cinnamomum micranthum f. kanehirae]
MNSDNKGLHHAEIRSRTLPGLTGRLDSGFGKPFCPDVLFFDLGRVIGRLPETLSIERTFAFLVVKSSGTEDYWIFSALSISALEQSPKSVTQQTLYMASRARGAPPLAVPRASPL